MFGGAYQWARPRVRPPAYVTAFARARPGDLDKVYREQEKRHGDKPAFYLEAADRFYQQRRYAEAARIALNALELPDADVTTMTIVADRLARYGQVERALWLYEKILHLEPDRPQPRRNLAMALVDRAELPGMPEGVRRADYRRALELLAEVVMTPWDQRYDGIEMISLNEANRIVPKLQRLGVSDIPLDPRLISLLDVDLRVVLEWNTDFTDMDLWVDEPSGQKARYDLPNTRIGGRLSNDMTAGYGPEEYMLRRAPGGRYVVRVQSFAADALNQNGATRVRARLYRGFGREDEESQEMELVLDPNGAEAQLVGVFRVGERPRASR